MEWPVTSEPSRAKARPLRPRRSCFGPADAAPPWWDRAAWVEPPGTAPGSDRFITTPVYRHSRPCGWPDQYRGAEVKKKGWPRRTLPRQPPHAAAAFRCWRNATSQRCDLRINDPWSDPPPRSIGELFRAFASMSLHGFAACCPGSAARDRGREALDDDAGVQRGIRRGAVPAGRERHQPRGLRLCADRARAGFDRACRLDAAMKLDGLDTLGVLAAHFALIACSQSAARWPWRRRCTAGRSRSPDR